MTASGFAEGLLARVQCAGTRQTVEPTRDRRRRMPTSQRAAAKRSMCSPAMRRVVWGRLDEMQPTDVINPLDVSRFFFEGRSEARLRGAAGAGPARVCRKTCRSKESTCRSSGAGDSIASTSRRRRSISPPAQALRIVACLAIGCPTLPPAGRRSRAGLLATTRRAARGSRHDRARGLGVSAYRGFEAVRALHSAERSIRRSAGRTRCVYPRFTMLGGDFETVAERGAFAARWRLSSSDAFQSPDCGRRRASRSTPASASIGGPATIGQRTVLVHSRAYDVRRSPIDGDGARRRVADRVGGSDVRAGAVSAQGFRRLQPDRSVGVRARHRAWRRCATTSRSRVRSAGSPATGAIDRPVRRQRLRLCAAEVLFLRHTRGLKLRVTGHL